MPACRQRAEFTKAKPKATQRPRSDRCGGRAAKGGVANRQWYCAPSARNQNTPARWNGNISNNNRSNDSGNNSPSPKN
jgi:hypothetical protein